MTGQPLAAAVRHLRETLASGDAAARGDAELLQAFAGHHDSSAFAVIVRRHGPMVLGVCRRVLGNEADAEDAFQATFLALARGPGAVRRGESLAGWLYGTASRIALKAKRDAARRRARENRSARPPQPDPVSELSWREVQEALAEEVARLVPAYRGAFVLCCLEGLSHAEVGRRLGVRVGTVSSRVSRARKRLHERLTRRGVELSAALATVSVASAGRAVVPRALAEATLRHALACAVGQPPTISGLSANVLTLAEGATRPMFATQMKFAAALLLALGLLGASALGHRLATAREPEAPNKPTAERPTNAPSRPPADAPEEKGEIVEVRGRVLGPDGEPAAGAEVFAWTAAKGKDDKSSSSTKAGPDGRFRLTVGAVDLKRGVTVIARAKGCSPDWAKLKAPAKGEITLRLPKDDIPVRGRILDLEGKPVAGATVEVRSLRKPDGKDLTPWVEAARRGSHPDLPRLGPRLVTEALGKPMTFTTDKEGRFRTAGFGRERAVGFLVKGPGIQQVEFWVITRPERPAGMRDGYYGVYAAKFDLIAGPGRAIVGTVTDRKTGKSVAGVTVGSVAHGNVYTKTDEKGRYRIEGVGKHPKYTVAAGGKVPYFNATKFDIADEPGLKPITVDFELSRGVLVRGRLTNKATGKPIRGRVSYRPASDNPNLKDYPDIGRLQILVGEVPGEVGPAGRFEVAAIPGPGALCVRAKPLDGFVRTPPELGTSALGGLILEYYHAVLKVNPDADDPKSLRRDIALEPGRALRATVTDPDGKPVSGVHVAGLSPVMQSFGDVRRLDKAQCKVGGLDARPRVILFAHPERKLAKLITVKGDEGRGGVTPPLRTLRLEPTGTAAGRLMDSRGRPQAGVKVTTFLERKHQAYGKELPLELLIEYRTWNKLLRARAVTDDDGRFRLDGLVPGLKYSVVTGDGAIEDPEAVLASGVTVAAGKTKDLGEVKDKKGKQE